MTREEWLLKRTFTGSAADPAVLADRKRALGVTVAVVLPTLNVAETVGPICAAIATAFMGSGGLVDDLVAIDSASRDDTVAVARAAGARVVQDAEVLPGVPAAHGKGNALWKSLAVTRSDIVVWIDSDIEDFDPGFVPGLLTPLLADPAIGYVKALYRRHLGGNPDDGGRVTEVCARPLINRFFPDLAGFVQPLSGEAAGRRVLLERLPFFTGYAVEIGLLIDILRHAGLTAMAQVDLGERRHRNQPTAALGRMAYEITEAVLARAGARQVEDLPPYARPIPRAGGFVLERTRVGLVERPPMASIMLADRR